MSLERTAYRKQRRPRMPETVTPEVSQLISIVETNPNPSHVQRWLMRTLNKHLDDELEAMAVMFASAWDPDIDTDRLKSLMSGGQHRMAINAIVAQIRREICAEMRKHKRAESDDFFDSCTVE